MKKIILLPVACFCLLASVSTAAPRFYGRVELDAVGPAADDVTRDADFQFRRERLGLRGTADRLSFRADLDFSDQYPEFRNAWLNADWPLLSLCAGQLRAPQGLAALTGPPDNPFPERSMLDELTPGRRLGLRATHASSRWLAQTALFAREIDDYLRDDADSAYDGLVARAVWAPRRDPGRVVHLGASLSRREAGPALRIAADPEAGADLAAWLVGDDLSGVERLETAGLEFLQIHGGVMVQAEYMWSRATPDGAGMRGLHGGYAQISWAPNGSARGYRFTSTSPGVSGGLTYRPRLWELAVRIGTLDLGSSHGTQTDLGVNWYLLENVRLMLHVLHAYRGETAAADDKGLDLWIARYEFSF